MTRFSRKLDLASGPMPHLQGKRTTANRVIPRAPSRNSRLATRIFPGEDLLSASQSALSRKVIYWQLGAHFQETPPRRPSRKNFRQRHLTGCPGRIFKERPGTTGHRARTFKENATPPATRAHFQGNVASVGWGGLARPRKDRPDELTGDVGRLYGVRLSNSSCGTKPSTTATADATARAVATGQEIGSFGMRRSATAMPTGPAYKIAVARM